MIEEIFVFILIMALSLAVTGFIMGGLFALEDMITRIKDDKK